MFSVGAIHPFSSPLAPPSNRIRSFGFWAFTPNPSAQNPKRKKKFENFLKQFRLLSEKRKGIHQLTRHIWLRLFTKAFTQIATQLQICRNVRQNCATLINQNYEKR